MKKLLSLFALLAIMITMVSCAAAKVENPTDYAKVENPIDYGKKYLLGENQYYVFEKDQTGYYECYCKYKHEYSDSSKYNYTLSGRVEFVWREASNGAVYLFETETSYNEDHTEGKTINVITDPIYFSEDFFTYSYSNQYGGNTVTYIKEGSNLEKSIDK